VPWRRAISFGSHDAGSDAVASARLTLHFTILMLKSAVPTAL
jgi:hypothetical protein